MVFEFSVNLKSKREALAFTVKDNVTCMLPQQSQD